MENKQAWYTNPWVEKTKILVLTMFFCLVTHFINFKKSGVEHGFFDLLPAMIVMVLDILLVSYIQTWIEKIPKWPKFPTAMYMTVFNTLIGIESICPLAPWLIANIGQTSLMPICTPVLAYAGISIGKDIEAFKKQGVTIIITAILTFIGTFLGSALIADLVLKATGGDRGF